jgi:1-acyl-sn-glycerol-3-phosphate acyltransferase
MIVIYWLRSLLFLAYGAITASLTATFLLLLFWAPQSLRSAITARYCKMLLGAGDFFCGMKVVLEGEENIPDEPCVIMIKHTTTLEAYGHVPFFPPTAWVVKRELTWVPFIGWAIKLVLQPIAIKRSAGRSAVMQVITQGKERLANGTWVTIFPEGTRVDPGQTRKYGVSGAALAKEAGVMIVPVAHNAGDVWPRRQLIKRPGLVRFCVGPPIDPQGRSPKETNLIVQEWIENKMAEISSVYQDNSRDESSP